jgi:hypothetical protein
VAELQWMMVTRRSSAKIRAHMYMVVVFVTRILPTLRALLIHGLSWKKY